MDNADHLIERQRRLIQRLQATRRDTARAEALLEVLQESARALQRYHDYLSSHTAPESSP